MEIKSSFNSTPEDIDSICVAICSAGPNQRHAGILYRDTNEEVKLLHLAWHDSLKNEPFLDDFLWLDIPLDSLNKQHMALVCEMIFEENAEKIPYGLGIDDCSFNDAGRFVPMEDHAGLTCATFVVKVFHDQNFLFIDVDGWKHRTSDKTWQIQILQYLEHKTSPALTHKYLDYHRKKIEQGSARFRPEEVVVARALEAPPHCAESVKEPSKELLIKVQEHFDELKIIKRREWLKTNGRQSSQL
jgi:hypothetical protein